MRAPLLGLAKSTYYLLLVSLGMTVRSCNFSPMCQPSLESIKNWKEMQVKPVFFLTSLLPICVSLLWSGWNTRHHFKIFLLLHWVTSAVTATLYDSGNSSYWNTKFDHHLFLSLQEFYLNKDKLTLKYHISNLMMKRDLQTKKKCMDFFYNVQKLIPNICQVSSSVLRFG